jgi:hypothetical protein
MHRLTVVRLFFKQKAEVMDKFILCNMKTKMVFRSRGNYRAEKYLEEISESFLNFFKRN